MIIFAVMADFNKLQKIKRRFFAMRNGQIADIFRRSGVPFRIVFGLNLPQIIEIADEFGPDHKLGIELWSNRSTRESMLVAPMLMSPAEITVEKAMEMLSDCPTAEVTDVLCHKLLRYMPEAAAVVGAASGSDNDTIRYGAVRLAFNLLREIPALAREVAQCELQRDCSMTKRVSQSLIDEADFLML